MCTSVRCLEQVNNLTLQHPNKAPPFEAQLFQSYHHSQLSLKKDFWLFRLICHCIANHTPHFPYHNTKLVVKEYCACCHSPTHSHARAHTRTHTTHTHTHTPHTHTHTHTHHTHTHTHTYKHDGLLDHALAS